MKIITLTVNPAIDKSAKVDGLIPDMKMKCHSIQHHPGGGGINISRLLKNLEMVSECIVAAGGCLGLLLQDLLEKEKVPVTVIKTESPTRENFSVVDTQTALQYRFGMPGGSLNHEKMDLVKTVILDKVNSGDILVLSGSLPENLSADFYAQVIGWVKNKKVKIVVDTAGIPLNKAVEQGVYLIKPNQKELAQLAGVELLTTKEQEEFAMQLITAGKAQLVAVSMGARGAFLASSKGIIYQATPSIKVKSTIGAGDSMVAGLIYGIQQNLTKNDILKWGVACGVATTLTEGTQLGNKEEIVRVFKMIG